MSWAPELNGNVIFSDVPIFICHTDYFYRTDRPLEASSEQTIRRKIVVGSVIGYEYPPSVARLRDSGLIVLEEAGSEILNLKKLDAGRVDAVLITHNEIKTYQSMCAKAGLRHEIRLAFASGELKSYIGFSTKHPRGQWARKRFNEGFARISKNGALRALTAKWKRIAQVEPTVTPY
jgi:ABC-type amino acid transport substrate-binding protein